jgi:hypothetical protein
MRAWRTLPQVTPPFWIQLDTEFLRHLTGSLARSGSEGCHGVHNWESSYPRTMSAFRGKATHPCSVGDARPAIASATAERQESRATFADPAPGHPLRHLPRMMRRSYGPRVACHRFSFTAQTTTTCAYRTGQPRPPHTTPYDSTAPTTNWMNVRSPTWSWGLFPSTLLSEQPRPRSNPIRGKQSLTR